MKPGMKNGAVIMAWVLAASLAMQTAHTVVAEEAPGITISIDKQTYHYCEKISYVISVFEVTGQVAVTHIIDQNQKSSQSIPIPIEALENKIKAPFPFERSIFPPGKYTIDAEYSGAHASASFELVDTGNVCIPTQIRQVAASWISGVFSDGFLIDAIKKSVDAELIGIPFEINQDSIYRIVIPEWVKTVVYWWIIDDISDEVVSGVFDHLLESGAIYIQQDGSGGSET